MFPSCGWSQPREISGPPPSQESRDCISRGQPNLVVGIGPVFKRSMFVASEMLLYNRPDRFLVWLTRPLTDKISKNEATPHKFAL